jgi:hypothetical protein
LFTLDDDLPSTRRVPPFLPEPVLTAFSVLIRYVEPGYAAHAHTDPRPYAFTFPVLAPSAEEAIRLARERFRETWLASGVGWERQITEITVSLAGEGGLPDR